MSFSRNAPYEIFDPYRKQLLDQSSCLYRASVTIKTLYHPTDAQIYNS